MHPVRPRLHSPVLGVRAGPARAYLTEVFLDFRFDADAQPALGLLALQYLLTNAQGLSVGLDRPPAWRLQRLQRGPGPLHPHLPLGTVLVTLLRAAIPQDPVALRRPLRGLDPVVDHVRPGLPARVRLTVAFTPGRSVLLQVAPEPTIPRACPGENRQKSPAATRNVAHVVARAELAVGHVQEVGVAGHLAQEVPGFDVNLVVSDVA